MGSDPVGKSACGAHRLRFASARCLLGMDVAGIGIFFSRSGPLTKGLFHPALRDTCNLGGL